MKFSLLKKPLIIIITVLGLLLIAIFQGGLYSKSETPVKDFPITADQEPKDETPKVISTNPSPLEEATILPTQTLEINFNQPLVNIPETRIVIEPNIDFKVELTNNNKTLKIIPNDPFSLGQGYTLNIQVGTKFENNKTLSDPVIFHFKTIEYRGA
ncbi:Ig-like domain-containing protein [Candidatus Daviesbacteria bacterium]|nr:Ig-like domain-containing protein [Candidatus Daviesbacteria bacterium]